jgi:hypothetical protein
MLKITVEMPDGQIRELDPDKQVICPGCWEVREVEEMVIVCNECAREYIKTVGTPKRVSTLRMAFQQSLEDGLPFILCVDCASTVAISHGHLH